MIRLETNKRAGDDYVAMLVQEPSCEFGQDNRVSTPSLAISAMGSLVTTGSQDLGLTSHPKDGAH